jgi:hypothetical protein
MTTGIRVRSLRPPTWIFAEGANFVGSKSIASEFKKLDGKLSIVRWGNNFAIGVPTHVAQSCWGMKCLVLHMDKRSMDFHGIETISPIDIVKYLNDLTEAGHPGHRLSGC